MHFLQTVAFQVPCLQMVFYVVLQDTRISEACGPGTVDCHLGEQIIYLVTNDELFLRGVLASKLQKHPSSHGKKRRGCESQGCQAKGKEIEG